MSARFRLTWPWRWKPKLRSLKWLLLFLSLFVPLMLFINAREEMPVELELGTRAPRYVISQADFSFLDSEATEALKQEAARDISGIYKVDEAETRSYRHAFENSLIEHQQWRHDLPRSTFEEVYKILDQIQDSLLQVRFTDERTLNKMRSLDLPASQFFLLELTDAKKEALFLPGVVWKSIQSQAMAIAGVHLEAVDYLIETFSRHLWPLQSDFVLQYSIQKKIRDQIENRYTHIEAGLQIVGKGEVVATRHITMLDAMRAAMDQTRKIWNPLSLLCSSLFALFVVVATLFFLYFFHRGVFKSFRKASLLVLITLMTLALSYGVECLFLSWSGELIAFKGVPLLMPLPALLVCVLVGAEVALGYCFALLIVLGTSLAVDPFYFLLTNFVASMGTIFFSRGMHRRKEVFSVCGKVWLTLIPLIFAFDVLEGGQVGFNLTAHLLSCALFLAMIAILCLVLLPLLESLFHVMTDMTLMEYMDPDCELLRRLSLEAPGTYQHSLVVGHIAEAAARAIGANGLLCRAAALYHDIGKLLHPHYFTENQLGGFNIHQLLTPQESTQVILAHVSEGEALARKHGLPQSFIDVIREHHGTTLVYYFYCKQVEQMGGDVTRVQERQFRYSGPKPKSKESAIIMMADTVEAASRSMGEMTEEALFHTVDKLISKKAEDGQFDECQLTFEELGRVKRALVCALIVTCHLRIKYPD